MGFAFYSFNDKEFFKTRPLSSNERLSIEGTPEYIENQSSDFSQIQQHLKVQWALKDIGFVKALEQVQREKPEEDKKPVVAVIDTGIHTKHPCFVGQLWVNKAEIPDNNKDDDKNGFIDDVHGWNFVDNNNDIQDYHGHGSHISGIIAAKGGTSCKVLGVSPLVKIMTLKYFDPHSKNSNNVDNTVKAVEYAVKMGADIINYSGGGPGASTNEKSAIAKAADKDIIFVAALGNEGSQIGNEESNIEEYYPASYKLGNIIAVQSHNKDNKKVESSNYKEIVLPGAKGKQTAPGEKIYSTLPPPVYLQGKLKVKEQRALASYRDNLYGYMTGTSQGTAVTTGVVALVKLVRPRWSMDQVINLIDQMGKLSAHGSVTMRPALTDRTDEAIVDPDKTNPNMKTHNSDPIESMMKIKDSIEKDLKDQTTQ